MTVVGFENHAGRTRLGEGVRPLGGCLHGHGNNGRDGGEGVHAGRILGTYIHGPLLPKNPALADLLIGEALRRRHGGSISSRSTTGSRRRARRRCRDRRRLVGDAAGAPRGRRTRGRLAPSRANPARS